MIRLIIVSHLTQLVSVIYKLLGKKVAHDKVKVSHLTQSVSVI